ncbi:hypothetical protein ONE63_000394 [Megalurothrips usitatus]|uniref:Tumor protein D54 n=1 Tax=Megalurothrips usitatus TaxID=439358 RepID=A0AAV7XYB0_9NEOP|nr:hypothetical protein ONE63_000394 [Megalurothrips usitatus]
MITNNNVEDAVAGARKAAAMALAAGEAADVVAGGVPDEEIEYPSLEYEEDVYYSHQPHATPSFDDVVEDDGDPEVGIPSGLPPASALAARLLGDEDLDDADVDQCLALAAVHGLDLDDLDVMVDVDADVGAYSVETEFVKPARGLLGLISKKRRRPLVRVTFQDLTKPYFSKMSSANNYRRFLQLVREEPLTDMSPDSGVSELQGLTPEEVEKQKEEWRKQLAEIEEEMQSLRVVLASKVKQSQDLKRKLGISVWRELTDDVSQGIKNVKESNVYQSVEEKFGQIGRAVSEQPVYQKTESVVKATAEKTTSILGGLGSGITMKLGQLKNSESFRSLEEKVGSAYENVKVRDWTKVSTSRSSSMQSFDEALRETEYKKGSTATTPTIPEDRPIS